MNYKINIFFINNIIKKLSNSIIMNNNINLRKGHDKMIEQEMLTRKNRKNKKKKSNNKRLLAKVFNNQNLSEGIFNQCEINNLGKLKKTSSKICLNLDEINPTFEKRFNFVVNNPNIKENYALDSEKIEYKRAKYLINSFNNLKDTTIKLYKKIQKHIEIEAENILKKFNISDYDLEDVYISKINEIITNNYLFCFKDPGELSRNDYKILTNKNRLQIYTKNNHRLIIVFSEWSDYKKNFIKYFNKYFNGNNIIYNKIKEILLDIQKNYKKNDNYYKLLVNEYDYNINILNNLNDKIDKFNDIINVKYRRTQN